MSRHAWMRGPGWRAAARRCRRVLPALAGTVALLAMLAGWPARSAEFVTPPGLNVEGQEALLKEQVTRIARELVGDALVEVLAQVRYVRTDGTSGRRIKLPGLNHYITPSGQGGGDIVAGHARVRQIVVMVAESERSTPEALADTIRQQGNFDPTRGDLVRVVKVPAPEEGGAAGGAMAAQGRGEGEGDDGLADDAEALSERLRAERERQRSNRRLGETIAEGALTEAQATTYLIRARQAYFNGNYERALDQILQSIAQNPDNPQAYAMLGSLYYAVDWKQLALKYWEKSLTLDPDNREIQQLVSQLRANPNF